MLRRTLPPLPVYIRFRARARKRLLLGWAGAEKHPSPRASIACPKSPPGMFDVGHAMLDVKERFAAKMPQESGLDKLG